jgi:hypothetical protein
MSAVRRLEIILSDPAAGLSRGRNIASGRKVGVVGMVNP